MKGYIEFVTVSGNAVLLNVKHVRHIAKEDWAAEGCVVATDEGFRYAVSDSYRTMRARLELAMDVE